MRSRTRAASILLLLLASTGASARAQDPAAPPAPAAQEPPVEKPVEKPAPAKPAQEKPTPEKPAPEKPAPAKPAAEKPAQKPAADKPTVETARRPEKVLVAMHVQGARRYTEGQLLSALGQKLGEPVDKAAVDSSLAILWTAFRVNGAVQYKEVDGGLELLLVVQEMNVDLEPRFIGNAQIKTETLKHWALLEDKGELYLFQAERVRQRLLEGYKKEGYAFAEVDVVRRGSDVSQEQEPELPDVIFEIREGPQVHVKNVIVRGNVSMPETGMWWWKDGIKKLAKIELGGPWLFNWYGDKFVRETLDGDILAMREVYRDRGFLDAVVELEPLEFTPDHTGVIVHIVVDEGQPYTVSALDIESVKHTFVPATRTFEDTPEPLLFDKSELLAMCKLHAGKRYARAQQNADSTALRDWYGKFGYISHPTLGSDYFEFLDPVLTFDPAKHEVAVTYRIAQGRKRYIREVLFQGAEHTRDRVVRREVDVLPGEIADLSKIRRSLSRLYSTSFFTDDQAPLQHHDPTFGFKPIDGQPELVDLEFKVEEGKVVNIQLQGGIDSNNGIFGRISLIMRNFDITDTPANWWHVFGDIFDKTAFHGAGQEVELDLQPGTEVNSYRIRFLEPDILRTHFDRYSLEFDLYRRARRQHFYDEDRTERRVRVGHEFTRQFSGFIGYTNTLLSVTNLDSPLLGLGDPTVPPLPDSIYQQVGDTVLSGVSLDFQYRNVDQTSNARSGMQCNLRNAVYGALGGGDYQFFKSSIDADWFWLLGLDEESVQPGIHLALGGGVADDYGDTKEVPYTERFFLGGTKILRGFDYRGVGPNRGENSLGGESFLSASLEYRYPLYSVTQPGSYKQVETFRLTLFSDAGVLGLAPWSVDPSEVRWTYGFGLGMIQPFPITLNFGFPILKGEGDRVEVFTFTIFNQWF